MRNVTLKATLKLIHQSGKEFEYSSVAPAELSDEDFYSLPEQLKAGNDEISDFFKRAFKEDMKFNVEFDDKIFNGRHFSMISMITEVVKDV